MAPKWGLASGGPHTPEKHGVGSMEGVCRWTKKCRKWHVCCTVLSSSSGLPLPLWIQKRSNYRHSYILSTMFTGAQGLPGKLSPALVKHSNVLCMIVKLHGLFWCWRGYMLNAIKNVLADISSVSPLSEQRRRANARNVSQHTLYGIQHIHINLTLIHCTFYRHADADQN